MKLENGKSTAPIPSVSADRDQPIPKIFEIV